MQDIQSQIDRWVKNRPFLAEIAELEKLVFETCHDFGPIEAYPIDFEKLENRVQQKELLLQNFLRPIIPTERAAELFKSLAKAAAEAELPPILVQAAKKLAEECEHDEALGPKIILLVLENDDDGLSRLSEEVSGGLNHNLIVYLAWASLNYVMAPYVQEINKWLAKNHKAWRKEYCPTCGSKPSMAHLHKTKNGRQRFLSCGYCKTKWVYKRIGCPFCGSETQSELAILDVEEEEIRIDICKGCNSYLKTYVDDGDEVIALADWSSLHLDAICRKKGYQAKKYSLYTF